MRYYEMKRDNGKETFKKQILYINATFLSYTTEQVSFKKNKVFLILRDFYSNQINVFWMKKIFF